MQIFQVSRIFIYIYVYLYHTHPHTCSNTYTEVHTHSTSLYLTPKYTHSYNILSYIYMYIFSERRQISTLFLRQHSHNSHCHIFHVKQFKIPNDLRGTFKNISGVNFHKLSELHSNRCAKFSYWLSSV